MYRTKNFIMALSASALLLGLLSGCASKGIDIIGDKRVTVIDHKSFKEGQFLKVIANLENDDNDEVEGFVYRVEWLDDKGILKDTTSWKPVVIHKNQKMQVVEMTNLPEITNYKVVISVPEKL
jgi:uncharacterized protein YcfL